MTETNTAWRRYSLYDFTDEGVKGITDKKGEQDYGSTAQHAGNER